MRQSRQLSTAAVIPSPQRENDILSEGWREIDRIFRASLKEKPADGDGGTLPDFTEGQTFDGRGGFQSPMHFTQPPKPYTEDTLLSAMENAGKDDIPDEAERKGLGTPATRGGNHRKAGGSRICGAKGQESYPHKSRYQPCHGPAGAADLSHADSGMGTEINGDRKGRR